MAEIRNGEIILSPDLLIIEGKLSFTKKPLLGYLSSKEKVISGVIIKDASADYYDGEYIVEPSKFEQTLETNNKVMAQDVTVKEIPYYETTNLSGGYTVIIA